MILRKIYHGLATFEADVHGAAVVARLVIRDLVAVVRDPLVGELAHHAGTVSVDDEDAIRTVPDLLAQELLEALMSNGRAPAGDALLAHRALMAEFVPKTADFLGSVL